MSKIRIKNFGPIKEGMLDNDGWIDIKKVTVFIGNQGSGKSTVAKLISTFTWIEKALVRGDFNKKNLTSGKIKKLCAYQNIGSYFKKDSVIEYVGQAFSISYDTEKVSISQLDIQDFSFPKIMYVPSERNFISSVKNVYELRGLPQTLYTFSDEDRLAKESLKETSLKLPVNNVNFEYRKQSKTSWIVGSDYEVPLNEASSGFQSFVPLFLVSKHLSLFINEERDPSIKEISIKERLRLKEEISKIYSNKKFSDEVKKTLIEQLSSRIQYSCFVNIVEEPEQNLFPTSQKNMLFSLLEFNNQSEGNKLIITTHSPYLLVYLTLCVEANRLQQKVNTNDLKSKLNAIVPLQSTVEGNNLVVYQLDEKGGTIEKLKDYKGLPSDENKLNDGLAEANDEFSKLLDLEDLCQ
jgi:predicted ATPase